MSDKFDMQTARQICKLLRIAYPSTVTAAANMLPAALDRIEELERRTYVAMRVGDSNLFVYGSDEATGKMREEIYSRQKRIAGLEGDRENLASRLNSAEAQTISYDEMAAQFREKCDNLEKALIEERAKHKTGAYFWAKAPMSMKTLYIHDAREQLEKEGIL